MRTIGYMFMRQPTAYRRFSDQEMVAALETTRGLVSLAAARLGCSAEAIYSRARKPGKVAEALARERERMLDIAELSLFDRIQAGEGWAVCFYLKTQGRARGYVQRQEVAAAVVIREYIGVDVSSV
jgi:hypothetical protein